MKRLRLDLWRSHDKCTGKVLSFPVRKYFERFASIEVPEYPQENKTEVSFDCEFSFCFYLSNIIANFENHHLRILLTDILHKFIIIISTTFNLFNANVLNTKRCAIRSFGSANRTNSQRKIVVHTDKITFALELHFLPEVQW